MQIILSNDYKNAHYIRETLHSVLYGLQIADKNFYHTIINKCYLYALTPRVLYQQSLQVIYVLTNPETYECLEPKWHEVVGKIYPYRETTLKTGYYEKEYWGFEEMLESKDQSELKVYSLSEAGMQEIPGVSYRVPSPQEKLARRQEFIETLPYARNFEKRDPEFGILGMYHLPSLDLINPTDSKAMLDKSIEIGRVSYRFLEKTEGLERLYHINQISSTTKKEGTTFFHTLDKDGEAFEASLEEWHKDHCSYNEDEEEEYSTQDIDWNLAPEDKMVLSYWMINKAHMTQVCINDGDPLDSKYPPFTKHIVKRLKQASAGDKKIDCDMHLTMMILLEIIDKSCEQHIYFDYERKCEGRIVPLKEVALVCLMSLIENKDFIKSITYLLKEGFLKLRIFESIIYLELLEKCYASAVSFFDKAIKNVKHYNPRLEVIHGAMGVRILKLVKDKKFLEKFNNFHGINIELTPLHWSEHKSPLQEKDILTVKNLYNQSSKSPGSETSHL